MIALRKLLSTVLSSTLVLFTLPPGAKAQAPQQGQQPPPSYSGQGQPMTPEELQGLVAPIALYPDALVAQILGAATYPDQVAIANYWLGQNKNLTGSSLMNAVNQQTWDPAVKALTQFPSVLDNMAQNLTWTSSLGEAYHNQQADVMSAIQTLRAKAKATGNLKSGSQITVVQQSPQTIVIEPANPQVIYVPQYNPTVVYGTPVTTPGYSTADVVATGLLSFGAGIAVGAMMSGGCCGWGYSAWHCNWYGGGAYYHGAAYYGNAAWHGGYYGDSYYHNGYYGNSYNNYYHNGSYNNAYNNGYHNYNSSNYNNSGYSHTGDTNYTHNTSGNTVNVNNVNPSGSHGSSSSGQGDKWGGWGDSSSSRGWGGSGGGGGSSAFSGWGSHSGSDGGGWGSRSASSRGWGGGGGGWRGGGGGGGGFGGRR
jgi:Protein of unknown function (DUF3300)